MIEDADDKAQIIDDKAQVIDRIEEVHVSFA